ncbi:hypothetical protein PIB30_111441, partial [Stylosanthes scabra]|nr:hypothetical protein [Stylosanthes scabra]
MVDWCDRDKWSLLEVYDMLERIGYLEENIDSLWYKSGGIGLKKLCVDKDAMELANVGVAKCIVELYVVHKLSVPVPDEFPYEIGYIDVGGGVNVGDEADCGPSVGVEAHDAAETEPSVGVEAHDGVECGPNVNLEAQNIKDEIEGAAEVGVKSDGLGQGAEDNVESKEITLGEFQQKIKENKQAKAKTRKTMKKKDKEATRVRTSSGLSDDEEINSDELKELQSEDGDDEDRTKSVS